MKPNRTKEDILLLSQLQQGDKKAFNTLFRRYYPILCAYAHRFVDLEDAEEIVQDVMLSLIHISRITSPRGPMPDFPTKRSLGTRGTCGW